MPIETDCPGCGQRLRVAEEHAGRQARCPSCSTVYVVPSATTLDKSPEPASVAPAESSSRAHESWRMKTPEGQTYGPVDKPELDRWVSQGRVNSQCQLEREGDGHWQSADRIYPHLARGSSQSPFAPAGSSSGAVNPYASSNVAPGSARSTGSQNDFRTPHRGPLVLTMGIVSWVLVVMGLPCPIFGIIAWILGSADLRAMNAGTMDDSGRSPTQIGQILGIVNTILTLLLYLVVVLFFVLIIAAA